MPTQNRKRKPPRKNMPETKRRRLKPAVRRAEFLEAALRVFWSRGPDQVRVEDITRAAGAAKGTFYLYFSSWTDFLVALRGHILSNYAADLRTRMAVGAPGEWWPAFEGECLRFVDFVVELGTLHQAVFHGPAADQPLDPSLSADTLLAGMLRSGIALGACRAVEEDAAAPLLFSVLHTTADGIAQHGDRDRKVKAMLDLVRVWLRVPVLNDRG